MHLSLSLICTVVIRIFKIIKEEATSFKWLNSVKYRDQHANFYFSRNSLISCNIWANLIKSVLLKVAPS